MSTRALAILFAIALVPVTADANLIVNGGFEEPDIAPGTFSIFPTIPGWSTTFGAGIEVQDHVAGSPFEGDQHVELDSNNNSGMIQTLIPTVPGESYHLGFAYSPRPGRSADDNTIQVFFGGGLLGTFAQSGVGLLDTSWTVFGFDVTASGSFSTVEFRAAGASTSFGGYLDAISFTGASVAEPSTLFLLGLSLLGMGLRRR